MDCYVFDLFHSLTFNFNIQMFYSMYVHLI